VEGEAPSDLSAEATPNLQPAADGQAKAELRQQRAAQPQPSALSRPPQRTGNAPRGRSGRRASRVRRLRTTRGRDPLDPRTCQLIVDISPPAMCRTWPARAGAPKLSGHPQEHVIYEMTCSWGCRAGRASRGIRRERTHASRGPGRRAQPGSAARVPGVRGLSVIAAYHRTATGARAASRAAAPPPAAPAPAARAGRATTPPPRSGRNRPTAESAPGRAGTPRPDSR